MPKMDGLKLCKEIRKIDFNVPIIVISNYSDREKLLDILPIKTVSYLLKPIRLTMLIEALESVLNELTINNKLNAQIADGLTYDFFSKHLVSNNQEIKLVNNEIVLLELLIQHKNTLVTNEIIMNTLAYDKDISYKSMANILYRLRKKIGKEHLHNIQSVGYILKSL